MTGMTAIQRIAEAKTHAANQTSGLVGGVAATLIGTIAVIALVLAMVGSTVGLGFESAGGPVDTVGVVGVGPLSAPAPPVR